MSYIFRSVKDACKLYNADYNRDFKFVTFASMQALAKKFDGEYLHNDGNRVDHFDVGFSLGLKINNREDSAIIVNVYNESYDDLYVVIRNEEEFKAFYEALLGAAKVDVLSEIIEK